MPHPALRRFAPGLLTLLAMPSLQAQETRLRPAPLRIESREGASLPRNFTEYQRLLQRTRSGHLLLLEPEGGPLAQGFKELLASEALLDLEVPVLSLSLQEDGFGRELATQFGWQGAHWAYVNPEGKVLLEGTVVPQPQAFQEQLMAAGFVDRARELETFLRTRPEHAEAQGELLRLRLLFAERRMAPLLKPRGTSDKETLAVVPELQRPLTDAEDQRIWGPSARSLETVLQGSHPFTSSVTWLTAFPASARHSPLMRSLSQRLLPGVVEAVLRAPRQSVPWQAWLRLAGTSGRLALKPVLAQVVVPPSNVPMAVPDVSLLQAYIRECRGAEDWTSLKDTARHGLDQLARTNGFLSDALKGMGMPVQVGAEDRKVLLTALLEAHLRLGETGQAETVLREAMAGSEGKAAATCGQKAAAMAGRADLVTAWGQLAEGGAK